MFKRKLNKIVGVLLLLFLITTCSYLLLPRPDLVAYHDYSRAFLDANDRLLRISLSDDEKYRLPVRLGAVSAYVQQATLLYEDQHFYQHPGVNPYALLRAFWSTYIKRDRVVGASTITMQLARLRWGIKTRTFWGKLTQIFRALQLARHYSKPEILQAYFNLASYGRNIEGIEAASLIYFNHHASELTLPEALSLAVVPQNPNKRNPTTQSGMANILHARKRLLSRWLEQHPNDKSKLVFMTLSLKIRKPEELPFLAPHFIQALNKTLPRDRTGFIHTSLNLDLHKRLKNQLIDYVTRKSQWGITNAAAAILDTRTMELSALQGSGGFFNNKISGQVNAFTARRSPGSALKPFIYALAMDQGLIHPMTLLKDAPRQFGGFTPENFDKQFTGPILAQRALITSRNVPAVTLQNKLSVNNNLYNLLQESGILNLKPESFYGLALGLGGVEVSMKEMLELYGMLVNGGEYRTLKLTKQKPVKYKPLSKKLISAEASFLTLDMLSNNLPPGTTATSIRGKNNYRVAWKTGTSYAFRDAWALGVAGPYVIAVWVGNFDGQGNPAFIGRSAAGPLLFEILAGLNIRTDWNKREHFNSDQLNLRKVKVCVSSGDLPGKYCPEISTSWFIPGVSPIKVSTIYREVNIDNKTGLRTCWPDKKNTHREIFAFWPSDLQYIFQQAGISIKKPPAYLAACQLNDLSTSGQQPKIRSPDSKLVYSIRSDRLNQEQIPFSAVVDADVRTQYWFLNNRFVGVSKRGQPYFWKPERGTFSLRVVDDHGRADEVQLRVEMVR